MREFEDEIHRNPSYYNIPEARRQSYHNRKRESVNNHYKIEINPASPNSYGRPNSRGIIKWGSEVSGTSSKYRSLLDYS